MDCRNTARGRSRIARAALITGALGAWLLPLSAAGAATSTTLPGPTPNQSQINSTESQVSQIEATLAQEEQQTSILDDKYNTAVQNLQNDQSEEQSLAAQLVSAKTAVKVDKHLVANDAVAAYIYGTPETGFASYFSQSASDSEARNQYTNQIVGNLQGDEGALERSESKLVSEQTQEQAAATQAQTEAAQTKSLATANEQEAATTKGTLDQVQGQLAQEVAQAAIQEAQQEAAAAAQAANQAAQQRAAAAAATAASVAGAVGGSSSAAAATDAANGAAGSSGYQGEIAGSTQGDSTQMAAVQAAVSQLGVPYVFGGEIPRQRVRLLGAGPVGLGPGRSLHPADHRDAVACPPARLARQPRAWGPALLLQPRRRRPGRPRRHVHGLGSLRRSHGDSGTVHGLHGLVLPHLHRRPHRRRPPVGARQICPTTAGAHGRPRR